MSKSKAKEIIEKNEESELKAESKKCYKFITNVQMGNDLFKKGECIRLTNAELPEFQQYVKICHGDKEVNNKPCNC